MKAGSSPAPPPPPHRPRSTRAPRASGISVSRTTASISLQVARPRQRSARARASSARTARNASLTRGIRGGGHREGTEAEPDQEHGLRRLARHLATHGERRPWARRRPRSPQACAGRRGGAARRARRPGGPSGPPPEVLDQVVRPHAEEVHLRGEEVGHEGRARHLEVHPHRHVLGEGRPSARSSVFACSSRSRASRRSLGPLTKGNMMRTGPWAPARRRARSCTRKGSGDRRRSRSALSPRAGFGLDGPRDRAPRDPRPRSARSRGAGASARRAGG